MKKSNSYFLFILLQSYLFFFVGCRHSETEKPLFKALDNEITGINFSNDLTPDSAFNMFKYMYFYNGAGVAAADFNNDGLTDLFFAGNQVKNALFLNKGELKFENAGATAGLPDDGGWNTGVSVVDINDDGLQDIYICRVGNFETLHSTNLLLVCTGIDANGIPHYQDSAAAYGLAFSGFSTQAVFFDFDLDGDLDMFLLNHAVHHSGMFAERGKFLNDYSELSGDRFYKNENGRYVDFTKQSGIYSSQIGYGLGVVVTDVNMDGWPDLYIGNDFHENDYLYINQKDGSFSDRITEQMAHTSQFSMGVDAADINNDAYPDIVSLDMLPNNPYILKRSLGEDAYDIFQMKVRYGYNHQYSRNNLQLNNGNGHFTEIGLYAGIYATDWSWSALWTDFDNDGLKDLFVGNGIPKRLNDMDYVNFVTNREFQQKIRNNSIHQKELAMIDQFPEIKLANHFFLNNGQAAFTDISANITGNIPTYSNGAIYADLDNDGDMDIVVNNINAPPLVYQNQSAPSPERKVFVADLKGAAGNRHAIGAKVLLFAGSEILTQEKQNVRGFLSSMNGPLMLGYGNRTIDSIWLVWPDDTYQNRTGLPDSGRLQINYTKGLPRTPWKVLQRDYENSVQPIQEQSKKRGIVYRHRENAFSEFDREPLLPHMLSKEGPALAVADINQDGLEDFFIGGARNQVPAIFIQNPSGLFEQKLQPDLAMDSAYEDVDAIWADVNKDGYPDLLVASGGNEFYGKDTMLSPRLYLGSKEGILHKKRDAFTGLNMTWSCIATEDFDGDGNPDLFLGARNVPYKYGTIPTSCLLSNDGSGRFTDVTDTWCPELRKAGFVTDALWYDMDADGKKDLLVSAEWNKLSVYKHKKQRLEKEEINTAKGWWNFILPVDYSGDGLPDLLAGNLGSNSRLKASIPQPVRLYAGDFDENGISEQLLTYYLDGREIPFANKDELQKQLPGLKKKYLYAADFARATLDELFPKGILKNKEILEADCFETSWMINEGKKGFTRKALPWTLQLTPYRCAVMLDINGDGKEDIFMGGNFFENNIQMGRNDAAGAAVLINDGNGNWKHVSPEPGLSLLEIRQVQCIRVGKKDMLLLACNNDFLRLISFDRKQ